MVAKTFLMSQATFLMGVIPADKKKLTEIETAIGQFACGNIKIAKDRFTIEWSKGGLAS
jgi:hypothetical protein